MKKRQKFNISGMTNEVKFESLTQQNVVEGPKKKKKKKHSLHKDVYQHQGAEEVLLGRTGQNFSNHPS